MLYKTFLFLLTTLLVISCRGQQSGISTETMSSQSTVTVVPSGSGGVVTPKVMLDRTQMTTGSVQDLYLMVKFDIPESEKAAANRPDLSLSMVIDRSGSMGGEKIEQVKEAARFGVNLLKPSDNVALIAYENSVATLWDMAPLNSKEMVNEVISSIRAGGGTNLCGGMDEGIGQLSRDSSSAMKRVLLLSDGLANHGVVDPEEIARRARKAYGKGISISTMGVGLGYNEDLMQAIAEAGGGNYFFIEDPASIREIFSEEMGSLFQTVAREVEISFSGTDAVSSYEIVGDTGKVYRLSSLFGGEKRVVLFKLKSNAAKPGDLKLGDLKLTFTNAETEKREEVRYAVSVTATKDSAAAEKSVVKAVRAEAVLVEAEEVHEKSVKLYEKGNKQEALAEIKRKNDELKQLNINLKDSRINSKIQALEMENSEMEQADQSAQMKNLYLKRSKERSYYAKKGKRGKFVVSSSSGKGSVVRVQKALQKSGHYSGNITGVYFEEIRAAVAQFQKDNGLGVDSVAGPQTLKALGLY